MDVGRPKPTADGCGAAKVNILMDVGQPNQRPMDVGRPKSTSDGCGAAKANVRWMWGSQSQHSNRCGAAKANIPTDVGQPKPSKANINVLMAELDVQR